MARTDPIVAKVLAAVLPSDIGLTSVTSYGASLVAAASASAARSLLSLGTAALNATGDFATAAQGATADAALPKSLGTIANQTLYTTGASTWAQTTLLAGWRNWLGTTKASWDEANGYLGIGTVTPSTQVEIHAGSGANANFRCTGNGQDYTAGFDVASGAGGHYLYGYANKSMVFGVNGQACLTLGSASAIASASHTLAGATLRMTSTSGVTANLSAQSGTSGSLDMATSTTVHYVYGNGAKSMEIGTNGVKRIGISSAGAVDIPGTLALGSGGTALTYVKVYAANITPASVNANTSAEQDFTVTGLTTADVVSLMNPAQTAGVGIVGVRVKAADTLTICFGNFTGGALTPAAGIHKLIAFRS